MLTTLAFLILMPAALAQVNATVKFEPDKWFFNATQAVGVMLTNDPASKTNIVKFELFVPKLDEIPLYKVKDDFTLPPGWTYSLSYKLGKVYKVTFTSEIGLAPGKLATFVMNEVISPLKPGEYEWQWEVIGADGSKAEGKVKTYATFGKLAKFEFEKVPEKIRAKETFEMVVVAYDEFGNVKEDYVARVKISSSDKEAEFPKEIEFRPEDKGKVKVNVTYRTAGLQFILVKDEEAKVIFSSPKTDVLPAIPTDLEVVIEGGVAFTTKPFVKLKLSAKNAKECRFSNDGVVWSEYEPYEEEKEWKLIPGEGTRVVYYQCKNEEGESQIVYSSIELRPAILPILPAISPTLISYLALAISLLAIGLSWKRRPKPRRREE
jgi:hypothetical protein